MVSLFTSESEVFHMESHLLWQRHMKKDGVCLCCGGEVEFVSHALWSVNSF